MSDLPVMGSLARPVRLDIFQRIIEVHWSVGGVVVVEIEYVPGQAAVSVLAPENVFISTSGLAEITPADYKDNPDWYANRVGEAAVIKEGIILQDEISDIWVWDAFLINEVGDDDGVAAATAAYGPVDLHYVGAQVAHDTQTFMRPVLGDWVQHTHPNGHSVTYAHGATPLTEAYLAWQQPEDAGGNLYNNVVVRPNDPNGVGTVESLATSESWYWYHLGSVPGSEASKVRQAWLIYFASDRTQSAELRTIPSGLSEDVSYSIRGYPTGTSFDVADGHITPQPGPDDIIISPRWEILATVPAAVEEVKTFSATGVSIE